MAGIRSRAVTATIVTSPNLESPDGLYAAYVAAHQGLSDAESELLNARLVLILANHIGDPIVLREALELARPKLQTAADSKSSPQP